MVTFTGARGWNCNICSWGTQFPLDIYVVPNFLQLIILQRTFFYINLCCLLLCLFLSDRLLEESDGSDGVSVRVQSGKQKILVGFYNNREFMQTFDHMGSRSG